MKVHRVNWYNLIHDAIIERFKVDTFVNTFCVLGEYSPVAVYYSQSPDRIQGHKSFLLIQILEDVDGEKKLMVRGMDQKDLAPYRFKDAVLCKNCKEVIFSVMRHDYRSCNCKTCSVDGGDDYLVFGGGDNATPVILDILSNTVIFEFTTATH